jgi:hypothetical protein
MLTARQFIFSSVAVAAAAVAQTIVLGWWIG